MKKVVIFILIMCLTLTFSACEIHPEEIPGHPNVIPETSTDETDTVM